MKVLVTGASSLLGGAVATVLSERGHDVTCFQRRPSGTGLRDVSGDIRDRAAVLAAAAGNNAVIHLAALVVPHAAWKDMRDVNITGTSHARSAAERCGRFVHISSPSVAFHDTASVGAAAEPAGYTGTDGYTKSKALAEQFVLASPAVPTLVVRPHLVWGPGDTQLVQRIVDRARAKRLVLPDAGRALIDTTYIDDAATAIAAALAHTNVGDEAVGRAWVVSGGEPRTVRDIVEAILAAAGVEWSPRSVPAPLAAAIGSLSDRLWRGNEPPITHFAARQLSVAHWFDQRETRRVLGWAPTVGLDQGFARLRAWFAAYEGGGGTSTPYSAGAP